MNIENTKRAYSKSDADLAQITDSMLDAAQRDLLALANYGVDAPWLLSIATANEDFKLCPPDEFWAGAMMSATYTKNLKREDVLKGTRQISERARISFGDDKGKWVQFATTELSRQTDNELVRTGRAVAHAATLYATELAAEGLTPAMTLAYTALVADFDLLIDIQKRKIKERDIAVEIRINKGNAVYVLLTKLSARGKLCWQDTSEAHYNDYIIYATHHTAISIIEGTVDGGVVVNTSVNDATAATIITLKNTGSVPLSFFYALNPTDTTGPKALTVPPNAEVAETAANLGLSLQLTRFNVYNDTPTAGTYRIEW